MTTDYRLYRIRQAGRTAIEHHPDRRQPYTVWVQGKVEGFDATRAAAERRLLTELQRREQLAAAAGAKMWPAERPGAIPEEHST